MNAERISSEAKSATPKWERKGEVEGITTDKVMLSITPDMSSTRLHGPLARIGRVAPEGAGRWPASGRVAPGYAGLRPASGSIPQSTRAP